ncbi:hypothetical protein [Enterococcus faecium]|uniref:hypothetical protein n=1 Tax=Enterococcus faecium TaxID=1352 RepID=UPI0039083820
MMMMMMMMMMIDTHTHIYMSACYASAVYLPALQVAYAPNLRQAPQAITVFHRSSSNIQ